MRILFTRIINISKSESIINVTIELENKQISSFTFQDKNYLKIQISYNTCAAIEVNSINLIYIEI